MESLRHVQALELQLQVRGGGAGRGRAWVGEDGQLPSPTCPGSSPVTRVTSRGPPSWREATVGVLRGCGHWARCPSGLGKERR